MKNSRRGFLTGSVALAAGAAAAQQNSDDAEVLDRLKRAQRVVLRDGIVLTMDSNLRDFEKADVLIEGNKIAAVAPNLAASARSALVVNAAGMILMPGFVDTHHHQYETILRSILADGLLRDEAKSYTTVIQGIFTPAYLPEDAYISELVASLNQINAGVTTTVDTSQVSLSPAHTDACIAGL